MSKNNCFILFFICFFTTHNAYAQFTAIPDENFEKVLIKLGIDTDRTINGKVLTEDVSGVTSLITHGSFVVAGDRINDLTGIQDFTSLTYLDIWGNILTIVDLSKNNKLITLICHNNSLSQLNISKLNALKHLNFSDNNIQRIDLSKNTGLITFISSFNPISSLEVSHLKNLDTLICNNNRLSNLNISKNKKLTFLDCSENSITNIDLSSNITLKNLFCKTNFITNLDFTKNTSLTILNCDSNRLSTLNLSQNEDLTELFCSNNELISLNMRNGNNTIVSEFDTTNNNDLYCILVDNSTYSEEYWPKKDSWSFYSEDCTLPEAFDDEYSVLEDTTLNIDEASGVLANDYDADPLTASLESDVSHGNLALSENGSFVYTPDLNFFGVDSFTYTANDGINGTSAATVTIIVEVDGYDVIVPNAFTPNGDHINDTFLPVYKGMKSVRLEIYDTWGNMIYVEENSELIGWDGTIKNSMAENGNYLYKINGTSLRGKKVFRNGLFTLIK